jgi:hypothetical protein
VLLRRSRPPWAGLGHRLGSPSSACASRTPSPVFPPHGCCWPPHPSYAGFKRGFRSPLRRLPLPFSARLRPRKLCRCRLPLHSPLPWVQTTTGTHYQGRRIQSHRRRHCRHRSQLHLHRRFPPRLTPPRWPRTTGCCLHCRRSLHPSPPPWKVACQSAPPPHLRPSSWVSPGSTPVTQQLLQGALMLMLMTATHQSYRATANRRTTALGVAAVSMPHKHWLHRLA